MAHAMKMAGIGKGWQRKTREADFEAKFKRRAETDQQWAEALRIFTTLQVAAVLEQP